jgi:hypothetical protein
MWAKYRISQKKISFDRMSALWQHALAIPRSKSRQSAFMNFLAVAKNSI